MYYLLTKRSGERFCLKKENGVYIDMMTNKEYKLVEEDKPTAITCNEAQMICNELCSKKCSSKEKENEVIVLIKPTDERDSLQTLLIELSRRGLYPYPTISHVFDGEEVEVLYGNLKSRNKKEFEKNKSYLISGTSMIAVINGKHARAIMESIIGDKDSKVADKCSLRSQIGWNITCNGIEIVDDVTEKMSVIAPILEEYKENQMVNVLRNKK